MIGRPKVRTRLSAGERWIRTCSEASRFILRTANCVGIERFTQELCGLPTVAINLPPSDSLSLPRGRFRRSRTRLSARVWPAGLPTGQQRLAECFDIASTGGNISVGPYSSTAVRLVVAPGLTRGRSVDL